MTNLEVREILLAAENSEVLGEHVDGHVDAHIDSVSLVTK